VNRLFDHERYRGIRRPIEAAETLPPECYTAEEFYRREVEQIFMKVWNLVGRLDYVPKPGDYFTIDLVGIPVIIMRGQDGQVRAFLNSCRHRGAKLLDGEGNCNFIRCPYHSWMYETNGKLRGAVGMQEAIDFRREDSGLIPIRLDTWFGFIFICFDRNAAPLADYLGDLDQYVRSYGFDTMVTVGRKTYELPTNWKLYVENSMEHFHLPTVHEKTIGNVQAEWSWVIGNPGNYLILHSKTERSRATLSGEAGFERIPTLEGQAAQGAQYILIYPATVLGCDLDSMWFKQLIPDGPARMRNVAAFCHQRRSVERPDFNEILPRYNRRFDLVIAEDNFISVRQMEGINNPLARAGRLSKSEPLVHVIDNWVLDRVLGPAPAAPLARSA
jgi:phenylpropionate dioxygenase-like ring-hydroxylating dioxygenase large terminal subunit